MSRHDDVEVDVHPDGSATIRFASEEGMNRVSACVRCMFQSDMDGTDIDPSIGDEAYAQIWDGMVNVLVHERCVREGDVIRDRWPARA